jgi:integrase
MEETVMKTRKNLDFSSGPVWNDTLKRWLVEINYPDRTRKRNRFRRERDANIWWAQQQKSIEDGSWKDVVQEAGITVGEALDRYEKYSEVHNRSHDTYASNGIGVLRKCLKPETLLRNARTADIEALKLHRLEEDGVSKTTVDKNIAVAKSFFTWCINQGLLPPGSNPAKKVRLFHENNERIRFLDPETEYPKFLKAVSEGLIARSSSLQTTDNKCGATATAWPQ